MRRVAPWALACGLLLAAAAYWFPERWSSRYDIHRIGPLQATSTRHRPNVVVVLLDTLRANYLDLYGYERQTSPFLTELAKDSAVFGRAFSTSSWTAPATASLFTARYSWNHGIVVGFFFHKMELAKALENGAEAWSINAFSPSEETLPMRLKRLGYSTLGVASNINIGDEMGFTRGFDRFVREPHATANGFHDYLKRWLPELRAAQPFFAYVHLNDCHEPYQKHPEYFSEEEALSGVDRSKYLSSIRYTDAQLRAIYDLLVTDDDTLFVVVSDHGEEFMDHGRVTHEDTLYDELNRVVMLVRAPGLGVVPNRFEGVNVSLIDVLPTILDLIGEAPPPQVDGTSLGPLLRNGSKAAALEEQIRRRVLFAHRRRTGDLWAAIEGHWKLIQLVDGSLELFDHRSDPQERNNVLAQHADVVSRLRDRLQPIQQTASRSVPKHEGRIKVDATLERELKSLGYLQ